MFYRYFLSSIYFFVLLHSKKKKKKVRLSDLPFLETGLLFPFCGETLHKRDSEECVDVVLKPVSVKSRIITEDSLILENLQETVSVVDVVESVFGWFRELKVKSSSDDIEWLGNKSRNSR